MRNSLVISVFLFIVLSFVVTINTVDNGFIRSEKIEQKTSLSTDLFADYDVVFVSVETGISTHGNFNNFGGSLKKYNPHHIFNAVLIESTILNSISNYLSQFSDIEVGLSISDIIFPFHYFW